MNRRQRKKRAKRDGLSWVLQDFTVAQTRYRLTAHPNGGRMLATRLPNGEGEVVAFFPRRNLRG